MFRFENINLTLSTPFQKLVQLCAPNTKRKCSKRSFPCVTRRTISASHPLSGFSFIGEKTCAKSDALPTCLERDLSNGARTKYLLALTRVYRMASWVCVLHLRVNRTSQPPARWHKCKLISDCPRRGEGDEREWRHNIRSSVAGKWDLEFVRRTQSSRLKWWLLVIVVRFGCNHSLSLIRSGFMLKKYLLVDNLYKKIFTDN